MLAQNTYGETIVFSLKKQARLNGFVAQAINEELLKSLDENFKVVVLDLSGIKFIDSSAFSMLLRIHKKALVCKKDFYLTSVSDEVKELISLTGLNHILQIKSTDMINSKSAD